MFQTKLEIFRYPIQRKNRFRSKTLFKMASTINHNMANLKCLIPSASPRPLSSGENPLSAGLWDYMRQKRERTGTIFKNLYMPEVLKTGLAKIRTHSTTWQLKTTRFVQRPIKSLYLTPGNKFMSLEAFPRVEV